MAWLPNPSERQRTFSRSAAITLALASMWLTTCAAPDEQTARPDEDADATTSGLAIPSTLNLLGYWTFDMADAQTADSSGKSPSAQLSNATWTPTGRSGGGMFFNGTNSLLTIPDGGWNVGKPATYNLWFKSEGPVTGYLLDHVFSSAASGALAIDAKGAKFRSYDSTRKARDQTFGTLPANTWTMLTVVVDATTIRLYTNGTLIGSTSRTLSKVAGVLNIGASAAGKNAFHGCIDEVAVFGRALSSAEVAQVYGLYPALPTSGGGATDPSLLGRWSFDDGTASDVSGHNANGVISGATPDSKGMFGKAMYFDGKSSYIDIPDGPWNAAATPVTYNVWFKPDGAPTGFILDHHEAWQSAGSFGFYLEDKDTNFQTWDAANKEFDFLGEPATESTWFMLTIVLDKTELRMYRNATLWKTITAAIPRSKGDLFLGVNETKWGYLKGWIDELTVFGRALTDTEITTLKTHPGCPSGTCGVRATGEPGCTSDSDCATGLVCQFGNGATYGLDPKMNVCARPAQCATTADCTGGRVCTSTSIGMMCIAPACTPNCAGKKCGDDPSDGCGGICPAICALHSAGCKSSNECGVGNSCGKAIGGRFGLAATANACWAYSCEDLVTPASMCGTTSSVCGTCPACVPQCSGRECGSDGCGGTCGSCASGKTCNEAGLCAANTIAPILTGATAAVGKLDGSLQVTPIGQAAYSIPITVPPGRHGLTPSLAFGYQSGASPAIGSYLGTGWSLGGLSAIGRCNKTVAQDGVASAPKMAPDDALCLDGQRLIPISTLSHDTEQQVTTIEYRTEMDQIAKITGRISDVLGPIAFEVRTREGRINTYLAPQVSSYNAAPNYEARLQDTIIWPIAISADHNGGNNTIRFFYDWLWSDSDNGTVFEYYPVAIKYEPGVTIELVYDDQPTEHREIWRWGIRHDTNRMLSHVRTLVGQTRVLDYGVTYESTDAAGKPVPRRIQSINVCENSGVCKNPTTFEYSVHQNGFQTHRSAGITNPLYLDAGHVVWDFNEDGIDDVLIRTYESNGGKTWAAWQSVRNANGTTDYQGLIYTGLPLGSTQSLYNTGEGAGALLDIDNDGRKEYVEFDYDPVDASGWAGNYYAVHAPVPGTNGAWTRTPTSIKKGDGGTYALDVDGDGVLDLLACDRDPAADSMHAGSGADEVGMWRLYVRGVLKNVTGATPGCPKSHGINTNSVTPVSYSESAEYGRVTDLDGDGRSELILSDNVSPSQIFRIDADGNGTLEPATWLSAIPNTPMTQTYYMDVNGDGLMDEVYGAFDYDGDANDHHGQELVQVRVTINRGNGSGIALQAGTLKLTMNEWRGAVITDATGDGISDLVIPVNSLNAWAVLPASTKGLTGFSTFPDPFRTLTVDIPSSEISGINVFLDANGDGTLDWLRLALTRIDIAASSWPTIPGLTKITDGFGAVTQIEYASTGTPSVHTPVARESCPVTQRCEARVGDVVRHVTTDDDISDANVPMQREYTYSGARIALEGRGFLGFDKITTTTTDLRTTGSHVFSSQQDVEYDNTTYDTQTHSYPFSTWPKHKVTQRFTQDASGFPLGMLVDDTQYAFGIQRPTDPGASRVVYPHIRTETESHGELFFSAAPLDLGGWSRSYVDAGLDAYGNSPKIVTSYSDGSKETVELTYQHATDARFVTEWLVSSVASKTETLTSPSVTGSQVRQTTYSYDPSGELHEIDVEPNDLKKVWRHSYGRDDYGNVTSERDEAPGVNVLRVRTIVYDPDANTYPRVVTNALNRKTTVNYDPATGQIVNSTDPNNMTSTFVYDGFGRKTSESFPDGKGSTFAYSSPSPARPFSVRAVQAGGDAVETDYDHGSRPVEIRRHDVTGTMVSESFGYDPLGRMVTHNLPHQGGGGTLVQTYYDSAGRLGGTTSPDGTTTNCYTGLIRCEQNARGFTSCRINDARGRLIRSVDPITTTERCDQGLAGAPTRAATQYTYDQSGNVATITDALATTTTVISDPYGRVTDLTDPDTGHTANVYDGLGELRQVTDANGRVSVFDYDDLGRPLSRTDTRSETTLRTVHYYWDEGENGTLEKTERIGLLSAVVSSPHAAPAVATDTWTRYQYRTGGLLTSREELSVNNDTFALAYGYDNFGRVNRVDYPAFNGTGFAITRSYGVNGALSVVADANTTTTKYWQAAGTDVYGLVSDELFGNTVRTTRIRDAMARLQDLTSAAGTTAAFQNDHYTYDPNGSLATRLNRVRNQQETLAHDSLDRIATATRPTSSDTFTYYANGNLETRSDVGTYTYSSGHAHAPSAAGSTAYTYDSMGNRLTEKGSDTSLTYTYGAINKPDTATVVGATGESTTTLTLAYDANDLRVRETIGDNTVTYLLNAYEESRTSTQPISARYYINGPDGIVAQADVNTSSTTPVVKYLHGDHLGSIEFVTDATGKVLEERSYAAFGNQRNVDWTSTAASRPQQTNISFTGQYAESSLPVINMVGRLYDPRIGQFTTADPLLAGVSSSQKLNRYAYVLNRPLSRVDPTGFDDEPMDDEVRLEEPNPDIEVLAPKIWDRGLHIVGEWEQIGLDSNADFVNGFLGGLGGYNPGVAVGPRLLGPVGTFGLGTLATGMRSFAKALAAADRPIKGVVAGCIACGMLSATAKGLENWAAIMDPNSSPADREGALKEEAVKAAIMVAAAGVGAAIGAAVEPAADAESTIANATSKAVSEAAEAEEEQLPELVFSRSKYPELAENIENAQAAGHPEVLTHGGDAAANRAAALEGVPNIQGLSRDEYPFASSMEGGGGSWVGHVPAAQQSAQGGLISNFLRANEITPGMSYRVVVGD